MIPLSPAAIFLCLELLLRPAAAPGPSQAAVDLAQRLNIAEFSFWHPGTDTPAVNRERLRLDAICGPGGSRPGCRTAQFRPAADRVAVLRGGPDARAPVVGYVYAVLKMRSDFEPDLDLEVQLSPTSRQRIIWLPASDIGYGVRYAGVRFHGPWIELVGGPFNRGTWINGTTEKLRGEAEAITGRLLQLPSMLSRNARGRAERLPAAVYFIERIGPNQVTLRAEVEADMPCGGDETPPKVMPPSYHVAVTEFFRADGTPRFESAYPKGC